MNVLVWKKCSSLEVYNIDKEDINLENYVLLHLERTFIEDIQSLNNILSRRDSEHITTFDTIKELCSFVKYCSEKHGVESEFEIFEVTKLL